MNRNSKASNWSPSKGRRFKLLNPSLYDLPAPGTYNPHDIDS